MPVNRREFLNVLCAAAAGGLALSASSARAQRAATRFYALPSFGNVHLLHFTDCHAQLLPSYFREPSVNIGVAGARGRPPHLVGEALLKHFGIPAHTRDAHAFTYLDFVAAARTYGKIGGFAHLATLVRELRGSRPGALLLDGGDSWQGSATSLWTRGQDMIDASKLLGVDVMTGHWEFTYGAERVREVVDNDFKGSIDFIAQNVVTADFGDPVFPAYTLREQNGVRVAVVGQAFPYTPIANPRYFVPDWTFGIREQEMQKVVDEVRAQGRAGRRPAVAQRHGRRPEARLARHAASTRSSVATRTTVCRRQRSSTTREDARWSPTQDATGSFSRCSISTCAMERSPITATSCCRYSRT